MKDNVLHKIAELSHQVKSKHPKEIRIHLASEGVSALNEAIKTKEQADLFMKRLKALELDA